MTDEYKHVDGSPFTVANIARPSICFSGKGNEEAGRLYVDEDGMLKFEGNADESAKVFFEYVIKYWKECK